MLTEKSIVSLQELIKLSLPIHLPRAYRDFILIVNREHILPKKPKDKRLTTILKHLIRLGIIKSKFDNKLQIVEDFKQKYLDYTKLNYMLLYVSRHEWKHTKYCLTYSNFQWIYIENE